MERGSSRSPRRPAAHTLDRLRGSFSRRRDAFRWSGQGMPVTEASMADHRLAELSRVCGANEPRCCPSRSGSSGSSTRWSSRREAGRMRDPASSGADVVRGEVLPRGAVQHDVTIVVRLPRDDSSSLHVAASGASAVAGAGAAAGPPASKMSIVLSPPPPPPSKSVPTETKDSREATDPEFARSDLRRAFVRTSGASGSSCWRGCRG